MSRKKSHNYGELAVTSGKVGEIEARAINRAGTRYDELMAQVGKLKGSAEVRVAIPEGTAARFRGLIGQRIVKTFGRKVYSILRATDDSVLLIRLREKTTAKPKAAKKSKPKKSKPAAKAEDVPAVETKVE